MKPLTKFAQGFLGLLDAKNLGQGLAQLEEALRGVVDMTDMYGADLQSTISAGPTNVIARGDGLNINVPSGQIWRVHGIHCAVDLAAGVYAVPTSIEVTYRPAATPVNAVVLAFAERPAQTTGSVTTLVACYAGPPILAMPGAQFDGFLLSVIPANSPMTVTLWGELYQQ